MRSIISAILLLSALTASAQSESFNTLRGKFRGQPDVVCFSASGLLARTALAIAGEHDYKKAIRHIKNFRLVTIPKEAFAHANVTVNGFKNILIKDSFVELTTIRDHGDDVSLYVQEGKKKKHDKYFILIDDDNEVIGIEIKGYIDPNVLTKQSASAQR